MNTKLAGAIAVGAFSLGVFTASAAPALGQDPKGPDADMTDVMAEHLAAMSEHMNDADMGSMMSMMGGMMPGSMMGPGASGMPMNPGASGMPMNPDHEAHHGSPAPEGTE